MNLSSQSPINKKNYEIIYDDYQNISNFLEKNKSKKVIVVQGLGFVGTAMSLVCANTDNSEYAVIGLDIPTKESYWKAGMIKEGLLPIESSDPNIGKFFANSMKKNNFFATADKRALNFADYVIIDVNLDVDKSINSNEFNVKIDGFKKAVIDVGENCKEDVIILVETTVPPGTCRMIVKPFVDECFSKRGLSKDRYVLGHSYERVMPGPNYINSIKNFYRVYSALKESDSKIIEDFLKTIISVEKYPLTKLATTEATEMAKVLENSYRAMNISFMVEWSRFAEDAGVNLYEVVNAIKMRPTHNNMMFPGIGVGGYCLTKDPLIASWASQEFFKSVKLESSENAVRINDQMPDYAFNYFKKKIIKKCESLNKIAILGVAYGPGIGDTRFSPVKKFYEQIKKICTNVTCFDPYVNFWEEVSIEVESDLNDLRNNEYDCIIIATKHIEFEGNEIIIELIKKGVIIFDTVGVFSETKDLHKFKNYFLLGSSTYEK